MASGAKFATGNAVQGGGPKYKEGMRLELRFGAGTGVEKAGGM
jgi:hypothetical protein